jgi:hypothetical protein
MAKSPVNAHSEISSSLHLFKKLKGEGLASLLLFFVVA